MGKEAELETLKAEKRKWERKRVGDAEKLNGANWMSDMAGKAAR